MRLIKFLLKLAVTGGIFAYLFTQIGKQTGEGAASLVQQHLASLSWGYVFAAVAVYSTSVVVSGYRWRAVSAALRMYHPLGFFIRRYYVGMWFSQVLPSGIGGDVIKAYDLAKASGRKKAAVMSVLLERASGLGALVGIVLVSLPLLWQLFGGHPLFWFLSAFGAVGLACVPVLALLHRLKGLYRRRATRFVWRLSRDVHRAFFSSWRVLIIQTVTSAYVQLVGVCVMWLLACALGVDISFLTMMALCPPIFLLLVVPISLAGWGLREGVAVGLFTLAGVMDASTALTLSLLYGGVTVVTSMPGGVFWLRNHK